MFSQSIYRKSIENSQASFVPNVSSGVALGIYTKSSAKQATPSVEEIRLKRAERFTLQNIASRLLPKERVCNCLRRRITKDKNVSIRYNEGRKKAHYDNLVRCGSVWTCPVCSAKISEARRSELKKAMDNLKKNGGAVYLMTLTNRHHVGDNLAYLLDRQSKALELFWSSRRKGGAVEVLGKLGKFGHIMATEVTYGENGWHPHFHILLFFENPINFKAVEKLLASHWQYCCVKKGMKEPSLERGCRIDDGAKAQEYVTKWGLEDEMTKGHTKKGREDSLTPFDLLRQSVECPEYEKLFQEYAICFKGKRQLVWSKGLKALLQVEEKTDEELATETEKESVMIKDIDFAIWTLINVYNHRAEILEACERDYLEGNSRRYNELVMKLAHYHVAELQSIADTA